MDTKKPVETENELWDAVAKSEYTLRRVAEMLDSGELIVKSGDVASLRESVEWAHSAIEREVKVKAMDEKPGFRLVDIPNADKAAMLIKGKPVFVHNFTGENINDNYDDVYNRTQRLAADDPENEYTLLFVSKDTVRTALVYGMQLTTTPLSHTAVPGVRSDG